MQTDFLRTFLLCHEDLRETQALKLKRLNSSEMRCKPHC